MTIVTAEVSGEIVIKVDELPVMALEQIKAALTFENEERAKMMSLQKFGAWDLPKTIELWRIEHRRSGEVVLCLPRGFSRDLAAGMSAMGIDLRWHDLRTEVQAAPGYYRQFALRDYQLAAVIDMIQAEQGVLESPAGSGKTVTMLGLMAFTNQRAVVVVDKVGLLEQWRERAAHFLGLGLDLKSDDPRTVGKIGDDAWEERDLTIALRQTLWARLWQVEALDWFKNKGMVVFDEAHHLASDTLSEICRKVPSKYIFGPSATPAKSEMKGNVVYSLIGPVVHRITRQELYDRDVLMRPSVELIRSDLQADFWPDHTVDSHTPCEVPGCPKSGVKAHKHNNNYSSCLKKLVEDKDRANLIASRIVAERGHVHLVPSRQLKHLDLLKKAVVSAGWDGPIYMLRGEENAAGLSQHIADAIHQGGQWEMVFREAAGGEEWEQATPIGEHGREAVIFSTVADEGLDIPPIDRIWITFPMRQESAIIQLVGRGERVSEGKVDAIIKDVVDPGCAIFQDQALERERVFRNIGYTVRLMP